jgi:hypothetical protein
MTAALPPLRPTDINPDMGMRHLHDAIYGGEVLCWRQSAPVRELIAATPSFRHSARLADGKKLSSVLALDRLTPYDGHGRLTSANDRASPATR